MKPETIAVLGAWIEAQRSANLETVATLIEVIKLFPAGPTREPAIDKLQKLASTAQSADTAAHLLFEELHKEAKNAAKS